MSTDETRPEDATSEQGGPADARSVGPDATYAGPPVGPDPAAPAADPATGPMAGAAPAAPGQQPYPESGFFASIRRGLFPRSDQRWVGGVAGGLAERIGWDPLLVRGLLIISFFLGGLGLILYGVGWALLPERDGRIHLQEAMRGNFDVAMLGAVAVLLMGFAWGGPLGWWDDGGWEWLAFLFWITVLGTTVYLIVQGVQRQRDNAARRQGAAPGAPVAGSPAGSPMPGTPAPGAPAPFTPAPPVEYRRADGLVYATGAGPAPHRQQAQAQAPYRSGPNAAYPNAAYPPRPTYPPPPRPARTTRGPGGTAVGVTLGVILLAGALLLAADRMDSIYLPGSADFLAAWLGIATVVLGIAILVAGLRGRTSGLLGFFAIVALLFGFAYVAVAGSAGPRWAGSAVESGQEIEDLVTQPRDPSATTITEGTIVVENVREAENGFYVQFGDPTIDLSQLDLSRIVPGDPLVVPIQLGAGQAVVIVPENMPVEANAYVAAGAVQWNVDDQDRSAAGVGSDYYFASDEVGDDGAVLSLEIEAGAGEVVVSESN